MKPAFLLLLLVSLAACADGDAAAPDAAAQTATAPADPNDVEAAADAYLASYPVRDLLSDMTDAMTANVPPAQRAQFETAMARVNTDTLETAMRRALVANFTAGELRALASFYGSPEGRSVMAKMPAYTADIMPTVQQEIMRAVGEAQQGTP